MSKDSYNPFKMWGSYLGIYLFGFIVYFLVSYYSDKLTFLASLGKAIEWLGLPSVSVLIPFLFIGFFVGWGIHSLFRRFSK